MHLDTRGEMICIDCLRISLNRMLLLAVGLWPYQQTKLVRLQLITFFIILISFIMFQFTAFITSKCTADLFINIFSSALLYIFFLIMYSWYRINIKVVKCLLEQLQNTYHELTDKNEINIIRKYGNYGKRHTTIVILIVVFFTPGPALYLFWPYFFDMLLSVNDSRPQSLPFIAEYFVDQRKYFYLILLHGFAALLIGIITMLGTGTIFIISQQYACGMFRIASYRIEQSMAIDSLQKGSLQNKNLIHKKLVRAVDMHREAMRLSDTTVSKFQVMYFLLIMVAVINGSLNLFRIFQVLSFEFNVKELLLPIISVLIYTSAVLISNYNAQEIIDHNNDVFITAYNIEWYAVSLNIQKIILFMLQRGTKTYSIKIAGLIVGSLESAATLLSTLISYFTVLYSTQM